MSSVILSGDTSGTVTLTAPAVAGSNTATLPVATGELSMLGGAGQTWQDVTASRVSGTTYTNNTGKPIFVSHTAISALGGDAQTALTISGIVICRSRGVPPNSSFTSGANVQGIVPNGATYSVTFSGATTSIWAELR